MENMKKEAIDTIKEQSELTADDLTNYQWVEITDMEDDRLNRRMFMKGKKIIPHICKCCKFFPEGLRDDASPPQELQLNADCLIPYINFVVGEKYRKSCKEKNLDGQCKDFIPYAKENDNEL